ncbi:MAG: response regulator [Oscillospiraceae bacterium]|nr:response regulator [Oscillospiraceae bacterium]
MPDNRVPKRRNTGITTRIRTVILLFTGVLGGGLIFVMAFFMNRLTDAILLETLQPMAKTAAQGIEGNLHTLAERFFTLRDNAVISSPDSTTDEKRQALDEFVSGVEFTWMGLYLPDGARLTGTGAAPSSVSARKVFADIKATETLVIADTSIGSRGAEIAMGLPVTLDGETAAYYLVGGYDYEIIGDILHKLNISPNSLAMIVNEDGKLIAHKTLEKVFRGESIAANLGTGADAEAVFQAVTGGQTGTMESEGAQGRLFVSFSPIRGTLWSLVIYAPRSDYVAATNQALMVSVIIVGAFLVGFSLFMTLFIRRTLSSPLKTIAGNADKLAQGKFESLAYTKALERRDEIGQLGAAFLAVSRSVQSLVGDIARLTGDAREGKLGERSDAAAYLGDFRNIISGINATLDVFCSHLDVMPEAVMFFDGARRSLYNNKAMRELLERHGLDESDPRLLDALMPLCAEDGFPPEVEALFSPHGGGESFQTDVGLTAEGGGEAYHYGLSLWRVNGETDETVPRDDDSTCVMLILNDVTQLTNAKSDAEAASRAKTEFLARMSHEMRTPMNAIIGMSSIGKSSDDPERKEYCLTRIGEASQHLLGIINDILDMSKIEADKFELAYAETDFEQMLQRVTNVINFRVQEKEQRLFVSLGKDIPARIIADEQRLAQVVTNLLTNAVKFTPEGGSITIRAEKTRETADVCTIRVEVKDTGIGISEEQQKRLFTAFEQADGSISRRFGGTGLGLAISKRIVELMGGSVWVESEVDKGSSFFFEFDAAKSKTEARVHSKPGDWADLRVLVAADAPEILELFTSVLTPLGVRCDTAVSGEFALEAVGVSSERFNIIFFDLNLSDMTGIEMAETLLEQGVKSTLILMTNDESGNLESDARAAGITGFLKKPLFPSALIDCINACAESQDDDAEDDPEPDSIDGIFAGINILVAEDVDINREILDALLEPTEISIDFAFDGEEAVEKFAAPNSYRLILMDIHMPKVDGYEATRRIRASGSPGADTVPIVAMTANVFREDVEKCLAAGMNDHLGKPVDMDKLIKTLSRYLL